MKVRLLNLVALAAIAMGAQGVAQQEGDSLERALADLNSGLIPSSVQGGAVSASGSNALEIYGDARVRNTWWNPDGGITDRKNVDARINLAMAFDVNANASAFAEINAHENWGTLGGVNVATGEVPNFNSAALNQAWFSGRNSILEGEEVKIGRSFYTLGSGRILGTDDWDQSPSSYSGIWITHPAEGLNLELFMITDAINGIGFNLPGPSPAPFSGDLDLYGVTFDWEFEWLVENLDFVDGMFVQPYWLRWAQQGTGLGSWDWYGLNVTGGLFEAVDYDLEAVWVDRRNAIPGAALDSNAWAVDLTFDIGEWVTDLPGNISPMVDVGYAMADDKGVTINPVYHDAAGIYDFHARNGGRGVWSGVADTWYIGIDMMPIEDVTTRIAWYNFDTALSGTDFNDASELDLAASYVFESGVQAWAGWAWVDYDSSLRAHDSAYIFYATLALPF